MPRLSRRALLAALATTAGCASTPGTGPGTNDTPTSSDTHSFPPPPTSAAPRSPTPLSTDTDWPQRGNTPDRRGRLDGSAVPQEPSLAWSFFSQISTPVVADGTLYAVETNREDLLVARDAATGRQQRAVALGGEAAAVPAVGDGRMYVQRYTAMEAYDPDGGGRLWRTEFGGGGPTAPAVVDGDVYAAQGAHQTPASVASFAPDGTERWTADVDVEPSDGTTPGVTDDAVVVPGSEAVVCLERADGAERWRFPVARGSATTPAVDDSTVYAGETGSEARLYAVDLADGSERWSRRTEDRASPT